MRKLGPLSAEHPLVKEQTVCPVCMFGFKAGDDCTLIVLGPDNDEDYQKLMEGRPHDTQAVPVHWSCRPGVPRNNRGMPQL